MSGSAPTDQRREIYFSGRVQGVGFRYTARQLAARWPVCGFVQNLRDGRVLLVAEGSPQSLDAFVAALEDEMDRYIGDKQVTISPARGEFVSFTVRH